MTLPRYQALLAALLVAALPVAAAATACDDAIRRVERESAIPTGLLRAIGLTESGRKTEAGYAPWPWTVNSPEGGTYLDDRAAAVQRIDELRQKGHRNIDVGCMQINLRHHPDAFASIEEAIDPLTNVRYAARFLSGLKRETGTWEKAIGRYHSATPDLAAAYRQRVAARWDKNEQPPEPTPIMTAERTTARPIRPTTPRTTASLAIDRAVESRPSRARPGAIGGFAPSAQPVAYAPLERLASLAAPGAVRPR